MDYIKVKTPFRVIPMEINLFTVKEVAEILRVNERTVYRYVEEGFLMAYKFNDGNFKKSRIVIPDFALRKFLENHSSDTTVDYIMKNKDFLKEIINSVVKKPTKENIVRLKKVLSVF